MKETRRASPFASQTRQEQLEQWICKQHCRQELPQEQSLTPEPPPLNGTLRNECRSAPREAAAPPCPQPGHRQYDAVISKMRSARRQAAQDQQWSG